MAAIGAHQMSECLQRKSLGSNTVLELDTAYCVEFQAARVLSQMTLWFWIVQDAVAQLAAFLFISLRNIPLASPQDTKLRGAPLAQIRSQPFSVGRRFSWWRADQLIYLSCKLWNVSRLLLAVNTNSTANTLYQCMICPFTGVCTNKLLHNRGCNPYYVTI